MKTIIFLAVFWLFNIQKAEVKTTEVKLAEEMLEHFFAEEFQKIIPLLTDNMRKVFTIKKMNEVNKSLKAQVGPLSKTSKIMEKSHEHFKIVEILCHFERGDLICRTAFNSEKLVAGWHFLPAN